MSEYCDAVWNSQLSLIAVIQPNSNSTAAHHQGVTKSLCCVFSSRSSTSHHESGRGHPLAGVGDQTV